MRMHGEIVPFIMMTRLSDCSEHDACASSAKCIESNRRSVCVR